MQRSRYQALNAVVMAVCLIGLPSSASALKLLDEQGNVLSDVVILVDGAAPRPAAPAVMDQIDMQFQPRVLAVGTGSRVDFPNSDDVRHHVYSFSAAKRFELRLFKGTDSPPVAFEQPGLVVLGCNIHDSMVGYILITDSPWYDVSDALGQLDASQLPAGNWPVSWWHPSLGEAAPVSLGELDLQLTAQLTLPVASTPVAVEKTLSPLQQRFRKAAEQHAH